MAYSEYTMENINIEESKINVEEKWYSLNELKNNVKNKINSDDFNVIPLISAVQELSTALDNITQVKLTLHNDLINNYKEFASNSGTTFESVLRDALISRVDHGITPTMSSAPGKPSKKVETKEKPAYKPKKVACRKCKAIITVDSPKRPVTISCPECGTKGKLSK